MITTIVGQNKKLSYHACRGWRPRQPARRSEVCIFFHKPCRGTKAVEGSGRRGRRPLQMRCGVIKVCGKNNNAKRRGGRDVGFLQSRNCAKPLQVCSRKIVGLAVFLFNFQVTFGVRHWVLSPWLRIHKIPQCTPTL